MSRFRNSRSKTMDLEKIIKELVREKKALDQSIALLEEMMATGGSAPKGRRGRKSMGPDEREEVSKRMKKYWASRRVKRSRDS